LRRKVASPVGGENWRSFEQRAEMELEKAGVNFDPQQMHGDSMPDFMLRTDGGARVAIIDPKSGVNDSHAQARNFAEISREQTESRMTIYVTPDGTSSQFTDPVLNVWKPEERFDKDQPGFDKLKAAQEFLEKHPGQTTMLTCKLDEVGNVAKAAAEPHNARERAEVSAADLRADVMSSSQCIDKSIAASGKLDSVVGPLDRIAPTPPPIATPPTSELL
jgi:hypothetical protein